MTRDLRAPVEMLAHEPDDASQFYADLFDLKMQGDPALNYYQVDAEGGPGGAFITVKDGARPGYIEYRVAAILVYTGADPVAGGARDA